MLRTIHIYILSVIMVGLAGVGTVDAQVKSPHQSHSQMNPVKTMHSSKVVKQDSVPKQSVTKEEATEVKAPDAKPESVAVPLKKIVVTRPPRSTPKKVYWTKDAGRRF